MLSAFAAACIRHAQRPGQTQLFLSFFYPACSLAKREARVGGSSIQSACAVHSTGSEESPFLAQSTSAVFQGQALPRSICSSSEAMSSGRPAIVRQWTSPVGSAKLVDGGVEALAQQQPQLVLYNSLVDEKVPFVPEAGLGSKQVCNRGMVTANCLQGCRQFCPVCLCSFCFASLWLTVLPLLVGVQLWSLVVSLVLFVLFHALLLFSTCVPLLPFCVLLVFCLNFLYLWLPCSHVPSALPFPL
jgi:hypothetical protein